MDASGWFEAIDSQRLYLLYASLTFLSCTVISIASSEHPIWRGPRKEAKRGPPCGPRVTRAS